MDTQKQGSLATSGPYMVVRHPQYVGFIRIMIGFLFMWPTLLTLAMFPILVFVYVRLAKKEKTSFGLNSDRFTMTMQEMFPHLYRDFQLNHP